MLARDGFPGGLGGGSFLAGLHGWDRISSGGVVKPERRRSSFRRGGVGFQVIEKLPYGILLACVQFRRMKRLLKGSHGIATASRPAVGLAEIGEGSTEGLMIPSS